MVYTVAAKDPFLIMLRKQTYEKEDLNKSYDRVCWDFLFSVMEKMWFDKIWISSVKECIYSVNYSINANGGQAFEVIPGRG